MTDINEMVVKSGESVSRITNVNTNTKIVRKFNVSKNDTTNKDYKVDWKFDFSKCTEEEILTWASQAVVIAYRKHFRKLPENEISKFADKTIDVHTEMVSERRTLTDAEKVQRAMSNMSDEDKAELIAQLTASIEAK